MKETLENMFVGVTIGMVILPSWNSVQSEPSGWYVFAVGAMLYWSVAIVRRWATEDKR